MSKEDFYTTLGVERGIDGDALKKAYRKLAMKYHPDRNPGDADAELKFKEVSHAYDILKDPNKRAAYDRYGHDAFENGGMGGAGGGGGQGFNQNFADVFEDLFGDFMGGGGGGRRQQSSARRGSDQRYSLDVSLEDAFSGSEAEITVPTTSTCDDCHGSGAEDGSEPEVCSGCGGAGKVRSQQGFFVVERTCTQCGGVGQVIKDPCKTCNGDGRIYKDKHLTVKIPAGVDDGTRIRLTGEGEAGVRGGPAGDLYIFVSIMPHELFQRDGTDLFCRVPIPMTSATLGGEVEVPLVGGGRATVKIPEGTPNAKQFRLKKKGMPQVHSSFHGDLIVEVKVETPVNLSKKQKDLLKQFAEEGNNNWSPESKGFLDRAKEFWDGLKD